MAKGDVLQIVVFSIIFAIALGMIGEKGRPVISCCEGVAETMFRFTNIIMHYAPIGVAAAIAVHGRRGGMEHALSLGQLVGTLYLALAVFYIGVFVPVALLFKIPLRKFFKAVREPAIIAFSTTIERGGAAARDGSDGAPRLSAPHRVVRAAARLHVQPRRHDALPLARVGVRRAGRGRPSRPSASRSR